jgi:hypothetical protein
MRLRLAGLTLVLAAGLLGASSGITGMWDGSMDLKSPDGEALKWDVYAEFQQAGKTVTGSAGPNLLQQYDIQRGVIEGNNLTFQVTIPGDPAPIYRMKLTLVKPDRLEGTVEVQIGPDQKLAGKVTLTRNK